MLYEQTMVRGKKRTIRYIQLVHHFLPHTIVGTYSIYKEVPEDGPLRSETCGADTEALIKT